MKAAPARDANSREEPPPGDAPTGGSNGEPTPQVVDANAAAAYQSNLSSLNQSLDATYSAAGGVQAGATFKFTAASARAVSMQETFPRPLVIGYLGFDFAIGEYGDLGPPIPTYSVVEYGATPALGTSSSAQLIGNSRMLTAKRSLRQMAEDGDKNAAALAAELDALGAIVPPVHPCNLYDSTGKISTASGKELRHDPPEFDDVAKFRGGLIRSIENLEKGLKKDGFQLQDGPAGDADHQFLRSRLAMCRAELEWLEERMSKYARVIAEADRYTAPYNAQ
jgi:hypothetical protein